MFAYTMLACEAYSLTLIRLCLVKHESPTSHLVPGKEAVRLSSFPTIIISLNISVGVGLAEIRFQVPPE